MPCVENITMKNFDPIKLLVLDIDGTLLNKEFKISDEVKNAVKKAIDKGVKVVIATGRMFSATIPIAVEMGLTTPLITYHGSLIKEFYNSEDILLHRTIPTDIAKKVVQDLRIMDCQTNLSVDDVLIAEVEKPVLKEYLRRRKINYKKVDSFDLLGDFSPTKINVIGEDPDRITEIRDALRAKYSESLYIAKSTAVFCEIIDKSVSKGNAILFLAQKWGIKPSEIMAIGDQDNDREMLRVAGLGVAMGNSTKGLKEIADYITGTVDENGVAQAIEKFILNEEV